MPNNIPRSSSSTVVEEKKENKDTINGPPYYSGDEIHAIEAQKIERRVCVPWTFRANEVLATWIGIQMNRIRTPPPAYDVDATPAYQENQSSEEYSLCRTICQISVWLIALAIAIIWTYFYILSQSEKLPSSPYIIGELILLTLYLAMLGFFICLNTLRTSFPLMVRLGDYATHDAGCWGRFFAILGVLAIWCCCILWVLAFPFIPGIGGVIARNIS